MPRRPFSVRGVKLQHTHSADDAGNCKGGDLSVILRYPYATRDQNQRRRYPGKVAAREIPQQASRKAIAAACEQERHAVHDQNDPENQYISFRRWRRSQVSCDTARVQREERSKAQATCRVRPQDH